MDTVEEENAAHLRRHPALELSLWMDWVGVVCDRMGIARPTGREWDALMATFEHGKMPITSVDELTWMRRLSSSPQSGGVLRK